MDIIPFIVSITTPSVLCSPLLLILTQSPGSKFLKVIDAGFLNNHFLGS
jgi:hypothetical protein